MIKSKLVEYTHATKQEEGGSGGGGGGKAIILPNGSIQNNSLELSLGINTSSSSSSNHNNINKVLYKDKMMASCSSTSSHEQPKAGHDHDHATTRLNTTTTSSLDHGLVQLSGYVAPSPSAAGTRTSWPFAQGFIHPWSLAARQQKAVFEQAHQRANPLSSSSATTPAVPRFTPPAPPQIVGWPPVRASRRNLVSPDTIKPEMDRDEKDAKKAKVSTEANGDIKKSLAGQVVKPATMFVKVNMEGFAVGRKINLKAHDSYESLSRALQKMFANFRSANYSNNSEEEEQDHEAHNSDYILLYEDHEGDRMLVGDVPWELFLTSVKRLYIALGPKTPKSDDEKVANDPN